MKKKGYQLSRTVMPEHYAIRIAPNFNTFLFDGVVDILASVRRRVDRITLHAHNLKITKAWVTDSYGARLDAISTRASVTFVDPQSGEKKREFFTSAAFLNHKKQTATFKFAGKLAAGSWQLHVEYQGSTVQPDLEGFYRSSWTDENGEMGWILSTQFEATHARMAVPCWDEPNRKATFDLTVETEPQYTVLGNGRQKGDCFVNENKVVSFFTTPKQSTYLVAWIEGKLESSEPVWANGVEMRIWSVPGKNHLKTYALKCAAYGLKWLERKFGHKYFGGDKIDLVAIPNFRSGAMENTSLITFRATALLVDLATATVGELQRVAEVIFHELVHQDCGNLVTMEDWDGLPLNESNAAIVAYWMMNDFQPEWHTFDSLGLMRAGAFALDSLKSTHPCWTPVSHPDEIEQKFDAITYNKGGSVEHMLHQYIGAEKLYRGMEIYLKRFAYGNAQVTDLWDALEEGTRESGLDLPVRQIMDAWFLQAGHPVVTVSQSDKSGFINLHQQRFSFLSDESHKEQLWPIPVHLRYATADGAIAEEKFLFTSREQEVFIEKGVEWVVVNASGPGYFRVNYSQELLAKLLAKPFSNLQVIERFNLVNDAWAMVRAQKLGCNSYLELVKRLAGENDPNVWSIISSSLMALHGLTSGEHRVAFKQLVQELAKPVFNDLGWMPKSGESSATLELRGSLAALLGTVGEDAEVQTKAVELFASWKQDRSTIDPNVVPALVSILAYTGDRARFDEFVALAEAAGTDQEKLRFQAALTRFPDLELNSRAINIILTEVKVDNAPSLLAASLGTAHGGKATWYAIKENWAMIVKKFPSRGIVGMIGACSALDNIEMQAEVQKFFSEHQLEQADQALAQMLERLSVNVRLRENETARLAAYLI